MLDNKLARSHTIYINICESLNAKNKKIVTLKREKRGPNIAVLHQHNSYKLSHFIKYTRIFQAF